MTTIDRIRQLASLGFVVATGLYLHVGVCARLTLAQTTVPNSVQFGPGHQTEGPGSGIPISPIVPNYGIAPVLPGPASANFRTPTSFFPMVPDSRLTFGAVMAADSVAIGGFGSGGFGFGGYGGFGIGGYGGFGYGGFGYPSMGAGVIGAPGLYGSLGGPTSGIGMSLPPTPELGGGAYRAGNQLPYSTVGMGIGVGNPADPAAPAAGNAGRISIGVPSEDAFDNAANGRPSPTRQVRSKPVRAARRPTVRKPTPQPSRKVEAKVTHAVPRRLEIPSAQRQKANLPQEEPSALKSEGTKPAPRRSLLGSPR
jgi:hypothetical protein